MICNFFTSDTLRIQKTSKNFLMMNKKLKDKLKYFNEKVNAVSNKKREKGTIQTLKS